MLDPSTRMLDPSRLGLSTRMLDPSRLGLSTRMLGLSTLELRNCRAEQKVRSRSHKVRSRNQGTPAAPALGPMRHPLKARGQWLRE
jgi:hypothetical protein